MHVLFASHRYHPVPGGTERIAQLLAESVVRGGGEATLITQSEPGTADREDVNGVDVRRLRMRPVAGVRFPSGYLRLLRGLRADVFHVQGNRIWCADFYFPVAPLFPWRQMVTGHGFYQYAIHRRAWDRWYFERYFPKVLRAFDHYVCDTEYERQQLLGWGVPAERLLRIPLGADLDEFRNAPTNAESVRAGWNLRAPLVGVYVGGFFENKRVDRLIEAAAGRRGKWALVLIGRDIPGSPYDRAHCEDLARKLGVEVRVPGVLSRADTVASLLAADAVVSGSDYEGFGVSLAESMAAGRPFLAWSAGAAPEMAATGAGIVAHSLEELGQGLERLEDDAERRRMSRRSTEASPEWSTETMCRRYGALYTRLAASGPRWQRHGD
ncbi:MAG TPA: glycosyltransferase family 4 protein [Thermoplasmata archaeon]|nr:glycosyltransferase family 4 protein [Thermoplasmata archaeon]